MTKWSHLPNAQYIDRVIESLKENPAAWTAAYDASHDASHAAEWVTARTAAFASAKYSAWDATWYAARYASGLNCSDTTLGVGEFSAADAAASSTAKSAAFDVAQYALGALVAYDNCGHLLDENTEHVKLLAALGDKTAVLMRQACVAIKGHRNN